MSDLFFSAEKAGHILSVVKIGQKHPTNVNSVCCMTRVLWQHNSIRGHPSRTSNVYEWPNQSMLNLPQHKCQHVQHIPPYEDSFTFALARPLTSCSPTLFTYLRWNVWSQQWLHTTRHRLSKYPLAASLEFAFEWSWSHTFGLSGSHREKI